MMVRPLPRLIRRELDGTDHAVAAAVSVTGTEGVGAGTGCAFLWLYPTRIDITSAANASQAIAEIDRAIDGVAAERAKYGSYISGYSTRQITCRTWRRIQLHPRVRFLMLIMRPRPLSWHVHRLFRRQVLRCWPRQIR